MANDRWVVFSRRSYLPQNHAIWENGRARFGHTVDAEGRRKRLFPHPHPLLPVAAPPLDNGQSAISKM